MRPAQPDALILLVSGYTDVKSAMAASVEYVDTCSRPPSSPAFRDLPGLW